MTGDANVTGDANGSLSADGPGVQVLVVDDHEVVHWGFGFLLQRQPWVTRCLSALDGARGVAMAERHRPEVALIDLFVGHDSGADICERVRRASPETRVLLISGAGRLSPAAARAAGASGFVSKDWAADDIASAVRLVSTGMSVFGQEPASAPTRLSGRERQVLELIATGATNREIGARLYLSPHTVKEHTSAVYRKLGVRNRAEAVNRAQRLGLVE